MFSTVATILFIVMKIDDNKRYYSILLLNGFSHRQVMSMIMGSLIFLLILSDTTAIHIFGFIISVVWGGVTLSLLTIVFHNIGLIGTIGMISYYKLKKLVVQLYIGGAE